MAEKWTTLKAGERWVSDEDLSSADLPQGVTLNHTCLKIRDPEISLAFYQEVLGFCKVMAWNNGLQTVFFVTQKDAQVSMPEVFKGMQSRQGLIELIHVHDNTAPVNASTAEPPRVGFFHLGVTVDSVQAILDRTSAFYQRRAATKAQSGIIKPLGSPQSNAQMGASESESPFHPGADFIFSQVAFIEDPDGNWIELVPKNMHGRPSQPST